MRPLRVLAAHGGTRGRKGKGERGRKTLGRMTRREKRAELPQATSAAQRNQTFRGLQQLPTSPVVWGCCSTAPRRSHRAQEITLGASFHFHCFVRGACVPRAGRRGQSTRISGTAAPTPSAKAELAQPCLNLASSPSRDKASQSQISARKMLFWLGSQSPLITHLPKYSCHTSSAPAARRQ